MAVWMALGFVTGADANQYLLLGVPLTVVFQRLVAVRPLRTLWVRDASEFHLGVSGAASALVFAVTPAYLLVRQLVSPRTSSTAAELTWLLCAVFGSVGAGYSFRHFSRPTLRALIGCLVTAGAIGVALLVAAWLARKPNMLPPGAAVTALRWFLLYLPVTFVLEEVFFRGALDAYIYRPGEPNRWGAAVFVSALWGLWHLPIVSSLGIAVVVGLVFVHTAVGVPLSLYWRQSGNLAVPGVAHAAIDAVRNALLT